MGDITSYPICKGWGKTFLMSCRTGRLFWFTHESPVWAVFRTGTRAWLRSTLVDTDPFDNYR